MFPKEARGNEIADIMRNVLDAVASGEMTPSEAQSVAAVVEGWRRAKEVGEMEDRLYALECVV